MTRELIVFAGFADWANTCGSWARAIHDHSERFDARCIVRDAHPFGYEQDIVLGEPHGGKGEPKGYESLDEVRELIDSATWYVHGGDSVYDSWKFFGDLIGKSLFRSGKRLGVWHCGSRYRQRHIRFNLIDRFRRLERRFIAYDLIRLASRDRRALAAPHNALDRRDFEHIEKADVLTVSHSPSKPTMPKRKGTHFFLEAVEKLRAKGHRFEVDLIHGVSNAECMERRARSHVFFDQISPVGGIGTSTVEAAAAGVCVIADYHNIGPDVQESTGGPWPVVPAHDFESLYSALERLITEAEHRERTALATSDWFQRVFSREAVAGFFDRAFGGNGRA